MAKYMNKVYKLMVGKKQISDVEYYECDAIADATQIAGDTGETVTIWEAEELEGVPYDALEWTMNMQVLCGKKKIPEEQDRKGDEKMKNGVITNVIGASYFEGGYASFDDAVEAMVSQWERMSSHERAVIKGRGYRNNRGEDFMIAVGSYDEETGESWDAMTLAEAIKAMEEEEEEEE